VGEFGLMDIEFVGSQDVWSNLGHEASISRLFALKIKDY
jgi:hypothetical protein